jgi:hypothetical protein
MAKAQFVLGAMKAVIQKKAENDAKAQIAADV